MTWFPSLTFTIEKASLRGSPESSLLIPQMPYFAPGVDQAEAKAFGPSEQTRNAFPQVLTTGKTEPSTVCSLGTKTSRRRIAGGPRCTRVVESLRVITRSQTLHCQDRGSTAQYNTEDVSNIASKPVTSSLFTGEMEHHPHGNISVLGHLFPTASCPGPAM